MKARVPASAAMMPPDTGASAAFSPPATAAAETARALSTSMVEQSMTSALGRALGMIDSLQTLRTWSPAGSMVTTTSAAPVASPAEAATRQPAPLARSSAAADRSNATTSWPALARLAAIPAPMAPSPMNAIVVMPNLVSRVVASGARCDAKFVAAAEPTVVC